MHPRNAWRGSKPGGTWQVSHRWKNWKLLQGVSGGPETTGKAPPGSPKPSKGGEDGMTYLLFDLEKDPGESLDVSSDNPLIVQLLQSKLQEYQRTYVPPIEDQDPGCGPFRGIMNTSQYGPTWTPWCSEVVVYSGVQ